MKLGKGEDGAHGNPFLLWSQKPNPTQNRGYENNQN